MHRFRGQPQFTKPLARFGHESGFSQGGRAFYATGTATQAITGIDVSDTKDPHVLWQGDVLSHGMSLSDDGNRAAARRVRHARRQARLPPLHMRCPPAPVTLRARTVALAADPFGGLWSRRSPTRRTKERTPWPRRPERTPS